MLYNFPVLQYVKSFNTLPTHTFHWDFIPTTRSDF